MPRAAHTTVVGTLVQRKRAAEAELGRAFARLTAARAKLDKASAALAEFEDKQRARLAHGRRAEARARTDAERGMKLDRREARFSTLKFRAVPGVSSSLAGTEARGADGASSLAVEELAGG